jgi:large subunit ribosomal protein L15
MQIHEVKREHKNRKKKTVGRGGRRGKTSGRGTKGQNARAGRKKRPELRDIIKKYPKLRGRGKNIFTSIQVKPAIVNLGEISKKFKDGETVSPETLLAKRLVSFSGGKLPKVKILSSGRLDKKIIVAGCILSGDAKEKITKAGGQIK